MKAYFGKRRIVVVVGVVVVVREVISNAFFNSIDVSFCRLSTKRPFASFQFPTVSLLLLPNILHVAYIQMCMIEIIMTCGHETPWDHHENVNGIMVSNIVNKLELFLL